MHQTTMPPRRRIPPNSKVVRRLDFGGGNTQAEYDNIINSKREIIMSYSAKYNFDFENEQALPGKYSWMMRNNLGKWIIMEVKDISHLTLPGGEIPPHYRDIAVETAPVDTTAAVTTAEKTPTDTIADVADAVTAPTDAVANVAAAENTPTDTTTANVASEMAPMPPAATATEMALTDTTAIAAAETAPIDKTALATIEMTPTHSTATTDAADYAPLKKKGMQEDRTLEKNEKARDDKTSEKRKMPRDDNKSHVKKKLRME